MLFIHGTLLAKVVYSKGFFLNLQLFDLQSNALTTEVNPQTILALYTT